MKTAKNAQFIRDLFILSQPELFLKYGRPKTKTSHQQLKRYYQKEYAKMERSPEPTPEHLNQFEELLRRSGVEPDDVAKITRLNVYQSSMKDENGEWNTIDQYAMQIVPKGKDSESFPQAQPARITPTRRKTPNRDYKTIFVFGDSQIDYRRIIDSRTGEQELVPIHDERAIRVAQLLCRDLQPDVIVNLGDTVDLASLSRFDPDSDHFFKTIGPSFQRAHDMYAQLRSDNPKADIVEVDSNHNTRLRNFVLKKMPQFHDIRRAGSDEEYPVMTYPYLANLGHVGVRFISGYGEASYIYGEEYDTPPIHFKHGETSPPGSTAAKESKNYPYSHIVRGHSHRADRVYTTMRGGNHAGNYLASIVVGTLCKITGEVPAVHSSVDDQNRPVHSYQAWQQGVLVIRDYNGHYTFDDVMIENGRAFYNGKEYDGND